MPDELLLEIFKLSLPEDIISLSSTSRRLRALAFDDKLWQGKLALHFPDVLDEKEKEDSKISPYTVFQTLYQHRYKKFTAKQRFLVSAVNEADRFTLDTLDISLGDILTTQIKDRNLLMMVHSNLRQERYSKEMGQKILDKFYDVCKIYFNTKSKDKNGYQLVHWAMLCKQLDKKKLLEQADICDKHGNKLLHIACLYDFKKSIHYLKTKTNINGPNSQGKTPLHMALQTGDIKLLEYLLRSEANGFAVDREGNGLLHMAVDYKHINVINWLLSLTKSVVHLLSLQNHYGETPLHRVLCHVDDRFLNHSMLSPDMVVPPEIITMVSLLCKAGANLHLRNEAGEKPLKKVIKNCSYYDMKPVIQILLDHGGIRSQKNLYSLLDFSVNNKIKQLITWHTYSNWALEELHVHNGTRLTNTGILRFYNRFYNRVSAFADYITKLKECDAIEFEKFIFLLLTHSKTTLEHLEIMMNISEIRTILSPVKILEIAELIYKKHQDKITIAIALLNKAIENLDQVDNQEMLTQAKDFLRLCNILLTEKICQNDQSVKTSASP